MDSDAPGDISSVTLHPVDKLDDVNDDLVDEGEWVLVAYDGDHNVVAKRRVGPLSIEGTYLGVPDDEDPRQRTAHDVMITIDHGEMRQKGGGIIIESEDPTIRLGKGFLADSSPIKKNG